MVSMALAQQLTLCLCMCLYLTAFHSSTTTAHDIKTIETLSRETGYPIETHQVETEDHYLLTFHRVPRGRDVGGAEGGGVRPPLLFVNGIMLCSYSILAKDKGLPYLLADAGYDVWLVNYRGNYYSRAHKSLDPIIDKQHFWNYTLTELGTLDLSAAFDYILGRTGQSRLVYVGASMGTTMFWVLGATRPEYMSKVTLMVGLAPVARFSLNGIHRQLGIYEENMYSEYYRRKIKAFCTNPEWLNLRCRIALSLIRHTMTGLTLDEFLKLLQIPSSSVSLNVLLHYLQIGRAQRFQKFDHGTKRNQALYRSSRPPELSLEGITCPVYLVYSRLDDISTVEDVQWLQEHLPNKPTRIIESVDGFNHMDFLLHEDADKLLNLPLVEYLRNKLS